MIDLSGNRPISSASLTCRLPVGDSTAIVLLALFAVFVVSVPKYDLAGIIAFAAFPLLFITAFGIPLLPMLKRLGMISPFILFMAGGNLLLDRAPFTLILGMHVTGGMVSSTVIAMKAAVTLTALLSVMFCMPFHRFGLALRGLGVPEVFVTQLILVYRYSFLLTDEATMMQKARDLRAFNGRGKGPLVTARLIGSLLIRTTSRAERIFMGMTSRGFRTALTSRPPIRFSSADLATLAGALLLFFAVRLFF